MKIFFPPVSIQKNVLSMFGLRDCSGGVGSFSDDGAIFISGMFDYLNKEQSVNIEQKEISERHQAEVLPQVMLDRYVCEIREELENGNIVKTPIPFGSLSAANAYWQKGTRNHERIVSAYAGRPWLVFLPNAELEVDDIDTTSFSHEEIYRFMLSLSEQYRSVEHVLTRF